MTEKVNKFQFLIGKVQRKKIARRKDKRNAKSFNSS